MGMAAILFNGAEPFKQTVKYPFNRWPDVYTLHNLRLYILPYMRVLCSRCSYFTSPLKQNREKNCKENLILLSLNGNDNINLHFCFGTYVCLFVLRFYNPVNPMGSCRARSVYLTTHLLGRLSPLSG